jgi:hypothetical protein
MDADRSQRILLRAHQLIELTRERIERSSALLLEMAERAEEEADADGAGHPVSAIMLRPPPPTEAGDLLPGV